MRTFLVQWNDNGKVVAEDVELEEGQKANRETFATIIDDGLNHWNGYSCSEWDILGWSLIEE